MQLKKEDGGEGKNSIEIRGKGTTEEEKRTWLTQNIKFNIYMSPPYAFTAPYMSTSRESYNFGLLI